MSRKVQKVGEAATCYSASGAVPIIKAPAGIGLMISVTKE